MLSIPLDDRTGGAAAQRPRRRRSGLARCSRDAWIAIARGRLIASGIDAVKVEPIARAMGVTRGSFYWHFADAAELRQALLEDWEARNYFEMARLRVRWLTGGGTPRDRIVATLGQDARLPPFELAMRLWAQRSTAARATAIRVDEAWIALLAQVIGADAAAPEARTLYLHHVGLHALVSA